MLRYATSAALALHPVARAPCFADNACMTLLPFRGAPGSRTKPRRDSAQDLMAADSFAARLALALNALNFSRGQLSASAGLDKSLVSRWLSGQAVPTSHNLARVSEALAQRKPGFNMTLWTASRADFDAFFGLPPPVSAAGSEEAPTGAASHDTSPAHPRLELNLSPRRFLQMAVAAGVLGILASWAWLWLSDRHDSSRIESQPPVIAGLSTAPAGSIAVLPFANIGREESQKYFSDGLTDEMIAALARVPGLRVAARSSSFALAGKNTDVRAAAKALNVRSILEGSVRQDGDRIRIEIALVNGFDGFQQWSQSFDRDLGNILGIQDEIAQNVAQIVTPTRVGKPRLSGRSATIDPTIYRKYLQAEVAFATRTEAGTALATALLREVTRAAPYFPDAFAAQASTLLRAASLKSADAKVTGEFQTALNRALTLDPTNPQALAVQIEYEASRLNWDKVISNALILRRLYPHNSMALDGLYSAYRALGLYDLALSAERESARLDPLSYIARRKLGYILVQYGHFGEAIDALKSSLEVQPGQPGAMSELCYAYAFAGRAAQAKSIEVQLSFPGMPLMERTYCSMGIALSSGDTVKSHAIAEEVARHYGDFGAQEDDLGKVFAAVGEYDRAAYWFERAYDRQVYFFDVYSEVAIPKALFRSPRWIALARRPAFQKWRASSALAQKLFRAVKS